MGSKAALITGAGRPQGIAAGIAFLLSDDGAWTTGQLIHSDGGFSS